MKKIKIISDLRGTEKMLSIYWFFILTILVGAVVIMVNLFHSSPYDVREIEANFMINKISTCLSENGKLNQNLFFEDNSEKKFKTNFDLLGECKIIFEETGSDEPLLEYMVEVNFLDSENNPLLNILEGNTNLKSNCEINSNKKYEKIPTCVNRNFYSLSPFDQDKIYSIEILSVVNKVNKNVK